MPPLLGALSLLDGGDASLFRLLQLRNFALPSHPCTTARNLLATIRPTRTWQVQCNRIRRTNRSMPRLRFRFTFCLPSFIDCRFPCVSSLSPAPASLSRSGESSSLGTSWRCLTISRPGTSLQESDIKEAADVLDAVPLVTPELLELTRWVSEYYLAPWGEVIKAALPPGISPTIDQFLSITENGRAELSKLSADSPTIKHRLLQLLTGAEELSLLKVADEFGRTQATRMTRELERDGLLEIKQRPGSGFVKAKFQRRVRLVVATENAADREGQRLTEAQARVIEALEALKGSDSLALPELLTQANVGSSSVTTLEKRKLVEVFQERLRRDPMADSFAESDPERRVATNQEYELTADQERVLAELDEPRGGELMRRFASWRDGKRQTEVSFAPCASPSVSAAQRSC